MCRGEAGRASIIVGLLPGLEDAGKVWSQCSFPELLHSLVESQADGVWGELRGPTAVFFSRDNPP